jgi:DNA-binding NtrC family response regulator
MPRDLFESAFFGHRRGAVTGADRDHAGRRVEAHGGVLFLDEVQALLYEHQAKLLRVLDDGEVTPVGGTRPRQVDVRFLAATNRDPRRMLEEGTLREDLYYRLRGFEIDLPPLRERREDIPLLAEHFLGDRLAEHFLGDRAEGFSPDALEALQRAPWPGNVRQLRNAVLAAAAASSGLRIGVRPLALDRETAAPPPAAAGALRGTLRDLERRAIHHALEDAAWNRSAAARSLGIDRSTLRRKMKEYELGDDEG